MKSSDKESRLADTIDAKYKVGQVWKYKTRPSEPNSTLTVVKVEHADKVGTIVHIYIADVKVRTNSAGTKYSTSISHSPFSKAAVDSSVTQLVTTVEKLPDYEEGYKEWRESFLTEDAGVFSIPVGKSVDYTEQTITDSTVVGQSP